MGKNNIVKLLTQHGQTAQKLINRFTKYLRGQDNVHDQFYA